MKPAVLMPGDRTEHGEVVLVEAQDFHGHRYSVTFDDGAGVLTKKFYWAVDDIEVLEEERLRPGDTAVNLEQQPMETNERET